MEIPPGYIDEMVEARRKGGVNLAEDGLFNARLAACKACEMCLDGIMCRICGCFVQFRALGRESYCPNPKGDLWEGVK
jgi:hypothetical protein